MNYLAVDTSSNACSVALQSQAGVAEKHIVEPRAHTKILIPMISELLADSGLSLRDLDAIVLGNGPGSFIGMRIGASVVQGLCFGANIPVVPVSSLAAIAAEVFTSSQHEYVVVAQDARMNEVYLACYQKGESGIPELMGEESIVAVGELAGTPASFSAAGAAWDRYPILVEANRQKIAAQSPVLTPRARHLLALGAASADAGGSVAPDKMTPAYLRQKVAEIPTNVRQ